MNTGCNVEGEPDSCDSEAEQCEAPAGGDPGDDRDGDPDETPGGDRDEPLDGDPGEPPDGAPLEHGTAHRTAQCCAESKVSELRFSEWLNSADAAAETASDRELDSALSTSAGLFLGGAGYLSAADRDAKQTPSRDRPGSPHQETHQAPNPELYSSYRDRSSKTAQYYCHATG